MNDLGQAIITGVYGSGKPFPIESELCRIHGVSRSVLREATKMLAAKGLLASRPRSGTWVQPDTAWNILDPDVLGWMMARNFEPGLLIEFMQVRLAVEPMAARLAAADGTPKAVAGIAAALDRMRAADSGADDVLESDIAFHVAVLQASGNRFYARLRDLVAAALHTSIRVSNQMKGVRLASVADHQRVYDAIVAHDADRAGAAMYALIDEARGLVTRWFESRAACG
jgi:DNA-binding FadR family transcriptional regulator